VKLFIAAPGAPAGGRQDRYARRRHLRVVAESLGRDDAVELEATTAAATIAALLEAHEAWSSSPTRAS
jgi:hypothetical protein